MTELDNTFFDIYTVYVLYAVIQAVVISAYLTFTSKEFNNYTAIELVVSFITIFIIIATLAPMYTFFMWCSLYRRIGAKQRCLVLLKKFWSGIG